MAVLALEGKAATSKETIVGTKATRGLDRLEVEVKHKSMWAIWIRRSRTRFS